MESDSPETQSTRRDFVSKTSCVVLGVFAACGISSVDALAVPIVETSAEAAQGTERSYALPSADGVSIDQDNDVILARFENRVYAFSLACPHQNAALRWIPRTTVFSARATRQNINLTGPTYPAD